MSKLGRRAHFKPEAQAKVIGRFHADGKPVDRRLRFLMLR